MSRKFNNLATSFADSDPAGSWAWRGLLACYLFERPQASVVRDVVTGQPAFFTSGSGGAKPVWSVDATGAHVTPSTAGNSSGIILDSHPSLGDHFTPEAMTMELWTELPPDVNSDPRGISKQSSGAGDDHDWMLGILDSGGNRRYRARLSTSGSTNTIVTEIDVVDGLRHIVVRYDGTTVSIWIDGVSQGVTSGPQTGTVDATAGMPIKIGNAAYSGADNSWDAKIYKAAIYGRALTDWEIQILARDPFRPFVRGPQLVLEPPAAVAGDGRIMSSLANAGGLAGMGGIAGKGGGLAA